MLFVKDFKNHLIISVDDDQTLSKSVQDELANFGKFLRDHGIQYTIGKSDRIFMAANMGRYCYRHVLHLHLDDVNYTAYKLIKD